MREVSFSVLYIVKRLKGTNIATSTMLISVNYFINKIASLKFPFNVLFVSLTMSTLLTFARKNSSLHSTTQLIAPLCRTGYYELVESRNSCGKSARDASELHGITPEKGKVPNSEQKTEDPPNDYF